MEAWNLGYDSAKRKAKEIYSKIGWISCPAFEGESVAFTSKGFDHLLRKGRIPRTRNEQKKRFVLITHAERIIKSTRATMFFRQSDEKYIVDRYGEKILQASVVYFWTFVGIAGDCRIKVVVRQLGEDKQKHFFSIMGDHVRISRS